MITVPPSLAGAVKFTLINAFPAATDTSVGAPGATATTVVAENVPLMPSIAKLATVAVLYEPEVVWRTATICPGLSVPAPVTNAPPFESGH